MKTENTEQNQTFPMYILIKKIGDEALFIKNEIVILAQRMGLPESYVKQVDCAMSNIQDVLSGFYHNPGHFVPDEEITKEENILFIKKALYQIGNLVKELVVELEKQTEATGEGQGWQTLLYGCGGDILNYVQQGEEVIKSLKQTI